MQQTYAHAIKIQAYTTILFQLINLYMHAIWNKFTLQQLHTTQTDRMRMQIPRAVFVSTQIKRRSVDATGTRGVTCYSGEICRRHTRWSRAQQHTTFTRTIVSKVCPKTYKLERALTKINFILLSKYSTQVLCPFRAWNGQLGGTKAKACPPNNHKLLTNGTTATCCRVSRQRELTLQAAIAAWNY